MVDNYQNFSRRLPDFNVILETNESIERFQDTFPEVMLLFRQISVPALRSDLVRLMVLSESGGMWLDSNTILLDPDGLRELFIKFRDFEFVIPLLKDSGFEMVTSALISKRRSKLALDTLRAVVLNLTKHYWTEKKSTEFIPYDFYYWVAPFVWREILGYKFTEDFKSHVAEIFRNDVTALTLDIAEFSSYQVALSTDFEKVVRFYGCNMDHHHNGNFHKHWSEVQKIQRLFY